ncbi:MAG TPA: glycosyltransferase [Candidatus Didemnitutus sp.]|jgi:glycosyltransferase involved in cell wall biosynthesis
MESSTHLVILPAYNPGPRLDEVVAGVLRRWQPVLVVDDGSTDGTAERLARLSAANPALGVLALPSNSGKGAAVLAGAAWARTRGFTHALVMDADGQHPEEHIVDFMEASLAAPPALIIGQPIFPANMPSERRHGRKLSIGLVHFELLGRVVADPLFGFRVYPLAPLLATLGPRGGGRRYDFDTEAAVRLVWAGVPPVNRAAPVRYFSPAEGGVSHFHYVRDNLTLVWMHTRLIAELLLFRWLILRGHRRRWRERAVTAAMMVAIILAVHGAGADALINPAHRITPGAAGWSVLADRIAHAADLEAPFTEQRFFPFKRDPVELHGEVRVSPTRGLSLHYRVPDERIVILDGKGVVIRATGDTAPPEDPRAGAVNQALLHILQFDFAALARDFDLYGDMSDQGWSLDLVPRTSAQRHAFSRISVSGRDVVVHHIELFHSAHQRIEIEIGEPRPATPFTPDEVRRFFR